MRIDKETLQLLYARINNHREYRQYRHNIAIAFIRFILTETKYKGLDGLCSMMSLSGIAVYAPLT